MMLKTIAITMSVVAVGAAPAQDWPSRTITMIVPFAAGGGIDVSARIQAIRMGELLGQTIVVDNIGGGGGTIGTAQAAA